MSALCTTAAWAQAPAQPGAPAAAAAPAAGPDLVILQGDRQTPGRVMGVTAAGLQIQIGAGIISLPLAQVKEVRMQVPAEFAAAQRAMLAHDLPAAQAALRALEKFRGLPTEWAQQVTTMLGDFYIEQGQLEKAEAAYRDFQRLYPQAQSGPQSEVGMARVAVAKKDFAGAKQRLEPIATRALTEKSIPAATAYTYSQVFLLMGQIRESEKDYAGSLTDYLRTVAVFYQDRAAAAQAQERADTLRKDHPDTFVN